MKRRNQSAFPTLVSLLSGGALARKVLPRYELDGPVVCTLVQQGFCNHTYAVETASATYYLRVYGYGWRSRAEILAEVDMLLHLHGRGLPVSRPLARKDGSYLTRVQAAEGRRYIALFTQAPGGPVDFRKLETCRAYGALIGRIHLCADEIPDDRRRFHLDFSHLVDEPLARIEAMASQRSAEVDYLRRIGDELKSRIEGWLPRTKPVYGHCHGDHNGDEVHIDADGAITMFDFDCCGYGWRAYDLAVILYNWNLGFFHSGNWAPKGKAMSTRRWQAVLRGYASVRGLSADELRAIEAFVPMRAIWGLGLHALVSARVEQAAIDYGFFDNQMRFIRYWLEQYRLA